MVYLERKERAHPTPFLMLCILDCKRYKIMWVPPLNSPFLWHTAMLQPYASAYTEFHSIWLSAVTGFLIPLSHLELGGTEVQ